MVMKCLSLLQVMILFLKYIFSDIHLATPAFFVVTICIVYLFLFFYFQSFCVFKPTVVSDKQHIDRTCFFFNLIWQSLFWLECLFHSYLMELLIWFLPSILLFCLYLISLLFLSSSFANYFCVKEIFFSVSR